MHIVHTIFMYKYIYIQIVETYERVILKTEVKHL